MEIVQTSLARAQERQKKWYDRNARVREFSEGDEVLILLPTSFNKLKAEWKGPYKVKRNVGTVNYEIETVGKRSTKIYHVNMLRKWHTPHGTSFFGEVDLEYNTDDNEAILELPRLNEKGGKVKISNKLTEKQREEMELLWKEFNDVLQDKPRRTDIAEHHIETGTANPVRQVPYTIPYAQREDIMKEVQRVEEMEVVQPSKSDWASPVVMIPKKDGTQRFCVDFRKVNSISKFDAYPMAQIDDIIDRLGRAKYWQVPFLKSQERLHSLRQLDYMNLQQCHLGHSIELLPLSKE